MEQPTPNSNAADSVVTGELKSFYRRAFSLRSMIYMVGICAVLIKLWPLARWTTFVVLAWLFFSNLRQLRSLILERHQLASLGLSPTQWCTCFLMRGTSTAVILQQILSTRPDDHKQIMAFDRLGLFDIDICIAVVLGLLPMAYAFEGQASTWKRKLQSTFVGLSLVVCLGALCFPLGVIHYFVANFTVAVNDAMMFPAHGQLPGPAYDHREALYQYCLSSFPALLGAVLALAGAFLLLFPNWKARWGIGLWVFGIATSAPSAWWLYTGGWKSLFVFPFDEPFQLEERQLGFLFAVSSLNIVVVLIAVTTGAKYSVVKSHELIKALSQFQPSFKLYWLVLLVGAWDLRNRPFQVSFLNVDFVVLFATVLCLLCVDPRRIRIWFLATRIWWRLIGLLLLAVVAAAYLYYFYNWIMDLFEANLNPQIVQIGVVVCGVLFCLWAIFMLFRPRIQRHWSEPPEMGLVRDGLSARNLIAVPILIATVLYLNVIGELTIFPLWIALTTI